MRPRFASQMLALIGIAATMAACTSATFPKIKIAAVPLAEESRAIRDADLAAALAEAERSAAPGAFDEATYNAAVEAFVFGLQARAKSKDWGGPIQISGGGRTWEVRFDQRAVADQGKPEWTPAVFDRIFPAAGFKCEGISRRLCWPGSGAPVVLAFDDVKSLAATRKFRPHNGIYVPGTAVLDFGAPPAPGGAMPVRLRLLNSFTEAKFAMGGKARPLARDLTAVVDATLDDPYITRNALEGFFRPNKRQEDSGLFGLTSYDPSKIPVVFVHGLRSDSHIWKNAVNELLADPALSARYQPLFFLYPSGLSVPSAAARFRESLREYRAFWDPAGTHQNLDRMILVGHSMGGLLCQLQVISSGEDFERAFFQSPVEDVPFLTDRQAAGIKRTLFFEPQPFVDRAVFIAVPHRGSTLADLKIVRLFIRLIHLPSDALGLATSALTEDPSFLNPALLSYNLLGLRSVDMLSPEHPYFKALEARAIEVPHHSIIGDRGKGDTPESSDGVVPYWSSHLPAAGSEVIVPYGHSCTHTPEVIAEILRVLRLHAEGVAR